MFLPKQTDVILRESMLDGNQRACLEAVRMSDRYHRPQEVAIIPKPTTKRVAYRSLTGGVQIMSDVDHAYWLNSNGMNCAGGWGTIEVPINATLEEMETLAQVELDKPLPK